MPRHRKYKAPAFVLFIAVSIILSASALLIGQAESRDSASARAYLKQRQFKVVQLGELMDADAPHMAFTNYKAQDGTTLTVIHYDFPSAVSAKEYLEKTIGKDKALRVIEKRDKTDDKGVVTGTRVRAESDSDRSAGPIHYVLWVNGPHYYEVSCNSLKAALAFEKVLN